MVGAQQEVDLARRLLSRTIPLLAALAAVAGASDFARAQATPGATPGAAPPAAASADPAVGSPLSNFLAARYAEARREYGEAARFYLQAIEREPANFDLMNRAVPVLAAAGRMEDAATLAARVLAVAPANPSANIVLIVRDLGAGNAAAAEPRLQALPTTGINRIAGPLLRAWTQMALGRPQQAADALRGLNQVQALTGLVAYHLALIADLAGNAEEAERQYRRALEVDGNPSIRAVEAAVGFFERTGRADEARAIQDRLRRTETDGAMRPRIADAKAGAAEALMNISVALRQDNRLSEAIVFGQYALALLPEDAGLTLLLGDAFESANRRLEANVLYGRIPASHPLSWLARLRMAENLDLSNDTAGAIAALQAMAGERPDRIDALTTLGRILRQHERFAEAATEYERAIARLPRPEPWQWGLYYQRGIAYERSRQWPKAEADFRRALELQPDQPDVLNYLAYSWIDRGETQHYAEAERMLARAVELRPNSPHILDSLAWAKYRLGRFPEAVTLLERAIELMPLDPTLLDHLGDAYWRVGRLQEARFQWQRALRNNPEAELRAQLERKAERGLEPIARSGN